MSGPSGDRPEVKTTGGVVRGVTREGLSTWRGVPYAAAPVGARRFRAPAPLEPWEGVRDAAASGPVPVQERTGEFVGAGRHTPVSEDCLTLSVTAPAAASTGPRPVMVWLYGGAFVVGAASSSTYRGRDLVRRGDVVLVGPNYRLGALGWLDLTGYATPERPIESNLGLRDQIAALEWVRDNIAAFGGDPGNVTVFGESAGGISVTTLLAVPAAEGLFHRAIAQSSAPGLAYGPELGRRWADHFVSALRERVPASSAVAALDAASTDDVLAASKTLRADLDSSPGTLVTAPAVDGDLLPEAPLDAFAGGRTHPVPLLIGTNDTEGRFFELPGLKVDLLATDERADAVFAATQPELREQVLAVYRGSRFRRDLGGDYMFWYPSVQVMESHRGPVYAYRYDFAPRLLRWLGLRATHAMELYAVFGLADSRAGRVLTSIGGRRGLRGLAERMPRDWTHFARHGRPASHWPTYDPEHRLTRIFDATDRIESDPRRERRLAWRGFRGYR